MKSVRPVYLRNIQPDSGSTRPKHLMRRINIYATSAIKRTEERLRGGTSRLRILGVNLLASTALSVAPQMFVPLWSADQAVAAPLDQWWNGTNTTGGGGIDGGTGTWNVQAGTTNWTDSSGVSAQAWAQGSNAYFAGDSGLVTLSGATSPLAAGLIFQTDAYTITGGTITLVAPSVGVAPSITAGTGVTATISSVLAGTDGLKTSGLGTIVLTGANSLSGNLLVDSGTLGVSGSGTLNVAAMDVGSSDSATLAISGGGSVTTTGLTYVGNGSEAV